MQIDPGRRDSQGLRRQSLDRSEVDSGEAPDSAVSITAQITDVGIEKQGKGRSYAVYTMEVRIRVARGDEEVRQVFRRYSDYYALHQTVSSEYPNLKDLPFPSKKAFGNTDKNVIEKRKTMLNSYVGELLRPEVLAQNEGLDIIMDRSVVNYINIS